MNIKYQRLLAVIFSICISGNVFAAAETYIGVGVIKSFKTKTTSSQIGQQIKLGLKFNQHISAELSAHSLGQHSFTNSTGTEDKFTVAGYGAGILIKPLGAFYITQQPYIRLSPYVTLSLNTILTNIYEQGDALGSPAIKEGSSKGLGAIGIESIVFKTGLSVYGEIAQMFDNSLQSPFIHTTIGLNYHF